MTSPTTAERTATGIETRIATVAWVLVGVFNPTWRAIATVGVAWVLALAARWTWLRTTRADREVLHT